MKPIPHVYLASRSPRRSQLLRSCNIAFDLVDSEIDESDYPDDIPLAEIAEYLACRKAENALGQIPEGVVLAADSLVICNGNLLGKPADAADARRMLHILSGRRHEVVTGVCIMDREKKVSFTDLSYVTFADLDDKEIDYYIDRFTPFDKAGAYAIQEWIGHCKIARIEGSYTNIMGLPTERVYRSLQYWSSTEQELTGDPT